MLPLPLEDAPKPPADTLPAWEECRFLSCSVLPVRVACNLRCPFCFSRSSLSALRREQTDWRRLDVEGYFRFARARGASRLVITGGGEPLLRPEDVIYLVRVGRRFFDEIACFSNAARLSRALARRLHEAGLSYLCYSRHAAADADNERLMGQGAPRLADVVEAAGPLPLRATCVMVRGFVDSREAVEHYLDALRPFGVREFTFKHTYVAYEQSLFGSSVENAWARAHQVEFDPFADEGEVLGRLPWGPSIRRIRGLQVCYYREPTPLWERTHRLCRSSNLLSDGKVYASLEDQRSLLSLPRCC